MPTDVLYVHCFHCGRNQRRRFRGAWFTCKHCGKRNPGPGLVRELLIDKLGGSSNGVPSKAEETATVILSGKRKEAAKPAPAAAKKEAQKKPAEPVTSTPKGRSALSRIVYGNG